MTALEGCMKDSVAPARLTRMQKAAVSLLIGLVILVAGCGDDSTAALPTPLPTVAPTSSPRPDPNVCAGLIALVTTAGHSGELRVANQALASVNGIVSAASGVGCFSNPIEAETFRQGMREDILVNRTRIEEACRGFRSQLAEIQGLITTSTQLYGPNDPLTARGRAIEGLVRSILASQC